MKTGYKSTLSLVKKGLTAPPPRLIGADYSTRGGEFYFFNGPGNLDYKFNNGTSNQSVRAFMDCAPLADIILKKAQAFANGRTWIVNKKGKAKGKEAQGEIATKIRTRMESPNPFQSQIEFEVQQYIYMQISGYCLVLPIKPVGFPNYDATKLWNIPPDIIDIEETQKSWILAEKQSDVIKKIVLNFGGERVYLNADDVFIMKDFTPTMKSSIFPVSRTEIHKDQINNIIGSYNTRGRIIDDRGAQGIISSDAKDAGGYVPVSEDQKEALQHDFLRYGMKRGQFQYIITSAAVKWTQIAQSTKDLMLFEEVEDDIMRLCDGWGYQYELMSSAKGVTFANKKEAKTLLYQDTIIPEAENIAEQWNRFWGINSLDIELVKDFSHVPALQDDRKKQAEARKTNNEAREKEFYNNVCTLNQWIMSNDDEPIEAEVGDKRYYELLAMGWKFGPSGAKAPEAAPADNNQQQNEQQQQ